MIISRKKLIIESLQKMDSNMLDVLLDDSLTYQNATKEIFLEKINEAFLELKSHGDTFLSANKGTCNSRLCNNKGCKGYSFVGNNSKRHIDLIFEEFNEEVKDIYHCNGFHIDNKNVETENLIHIDILHDEKADFKPSIEFLIKSQKCNLACEELNQYRDTIIDKNVYLEWLEKFYPLFTSLNMLHVDYTEYSKFYWLYYRINELKEFLECDTLSKEAIRKFLTIDLKTDFQLLKWLIKYEKTSNELTLFLYEEIDFEFPENSDFFIVDGFKINTSEFKHIAKFKFLHDKHYCEMLEKYTTFSNEETRKYKNENSKMSAKLYSLAHHLTKRGIDL